MDIGTLYKIFDNRFKGEVLPYIEQKLKRDFFSEPIYYYIDNFHLRTFRSVLPLIISEHTRVNYRDALSIGAASELIFFIALVQDDFIDNDNVRASIPASHQKYGVRRTMASAAYSYTAVNEMLLDLLDSGLPKAVVKTVYNGFRISYQNLYRSFLTELRKNPLTESITKDYVKKIYLDKTAQGTNSIYCMGVLIEKGRENFLASSFKKYAELLAIAGQIKNDIYDYTRYFKHRGFSDFRNEYPSYILTFLKHSDPELLIKIYNKRDIKLLMHLINKHSIFQKLEKEINDLVNQAVSIIEQTSLASSLKIILKVWAEGNRKINVNLESNN